MIVIAKKNKNKQLPKGIGETDKCQSDDVMHHHDSRVLPPGVHVDGGIDGVTVKAALDQVGDGDVYRHWHSTLPVWRNEEEMSVSETHLDLPAINLGEEENYGIQS